MKWIILVLFLMCYGNINAQHNYTQNSFCTSDSIYSNVYKYIIADSLFTGKSINVLDTFTGTSYVFFFDEIKTAGDDKESLYIKLYELDSKNSPDSTAYKSFGRLFKKHANPDAILSFSKIIGNELFADVHIGNYNSNAFGETVLYYIKINSDKEIESVIKNLYYGL